MELASDKCRRWDASDVGHASLKGSKEWICYFPATKEKKAGGLRPEEEIVGSKGSGGEFVREEVECLKCLGWGWPKSWR